jgi:uncharacterized protein (UPF0332 family)
MLSEKRIKEAETNVRAYLNEGLLRKSSSDDKIIALFINNAKESLIVADEIFKKEISDLWTIVTAYYSMYYYANAILLKLGYKIGDKIVHKIAADSLIVFVRDKIKKSILEEYEEIKNEALNLAGIKADEIISSFDLEKEKRSLIQYRTLDVEKKSKAITSLKRAKDFAIEINKLLID